MEKLSVCIDQSAIQLIISAILHRICASYFHLNAKTGNELKILKKLGCLTFGV